MVDLATPVEDDEDGSGPEEEGKPTTTLDLGAAAFRMLEKLVGEAEVDWKVRFYLDIILIRIYIHVPFFILGLSWRRA